MGIQPVSDHAGDAVTADRIRQWTTGIGIAAGAAVAAVVLGAGAAHADGGTDEINGWAVTPGATLTVSFNPFNAFTATLSDPSGSLGLGTSPIAGEWASMSTPFSSAGVDDEFTAQATATLPGTLTISDLWLPGFELAYVKADDFGNPLAGDFADLSEADTRAWLLPSVDGTQVIDVYQTGFNLGGQAVPLVNPDATGPIDVGGVELASPHDGALLNDVFSAIFTGDGADWGRAETLFDAWLGTNPSDVPGAAEAGDLFGGF